MQHRRTHLPLSSAGLIIGGLVLMAVTFSSVPPSHAQQPVIDAACELDPGEQQAALTQFRSLQSRYAIVATHAAMTIELHGELHELTQVLNYVEARDAECCARLEFSRRVIPGGVALTISGEATMLGVISSMLQAALNP